MSRAATKDSVCRAATIGRDSGHISESSERSIVRLGSTRAGQMWFGLRCGYSRPDVGCGIRGLAPMGWPLWLGTVVRQQIRDTCLPPDVRHMV